MRASTDGTSISSPVTFNSATVNLTCDTSNGAQISALLSSTSDGKGNVLADNFIKVTVVGATTSGPVDVCRGGNTETGAPQFNCFNDTYRGAATGLVGKDVDSFASQGGVEPINVSYLLTSGVQQVTFDVVDTGVLLTNASLYLVTSCTQGGVTGPATVTGNPIPANDPKSGDLTQDFTFNPTPGQDVGFTYDLSRSQENGQLQITDSTIPSTKDMPLDPTLWQSVYATGYIVCDIELPGAQR